MSRVLSLSALTVLDLAPPDLVRCAAETGYGAVGLRLVPATPDEPSWPMVGRTPLVERTRLLADDLGIPVWDIEILRLTETTDVREFEAFLETGAYLGASQILVAGMDPERGRLAENLAALAAFAEPYGLTPNLEFMPWTAVSDLADAAEVLRAAAHPNVGLLIDSIHFARSGSDPELIDALPVEWFRYAQLCDAPAREPADQAELIYQARNARLPPGEGGLDVLAPLRHLPPDLPLGVEAPFENHAGIPARIRATRALQATRAVLDRLSGDA